MLWLLLLIAVVVAVALYFRGGRGISWTNMSVFESVLWAVVLVFITIALVQILAVALGD